MTINIEFNSKDMPLFIWLLIPGVVTIVVGKGYNIELLTKCGTYFTLFILGTAAIAILRDYF